MWTPLPSSSDFSFFRQLFVSDALHWTCFLTDGALCRSGFAVLFPDTCGDTLVHRLCWGFCFPAFGWKADPCWQAIVWLFKAISNWVLLFCFCLQRSRSYWFGQFESCVLWDFNVSCKWKQARCSERKNPLIYNQSRFAFTAFVKTKSASLLVVRSASKTRLGVKAFSPFLWN